jgi:hypothetical protein
MTDLPTIIRATRASASALARMQYAARRIRTERWPGDRAHAQKSLPVPNATMRERKLF